MAMGESSYVDSCHSIVDTRAMVENALKERPGLNTSLRVIGEPMMSVVAFESVDPVIDIYDVADGMSTKGWHSDMLQDPPGIHVAITTPMVKAVDILIEDLVSVVEAEKEKAVQRVKDRGVAEKQRKKRWFSRSRMEEWRRSREGRPTRCMGFRAKFQIKV
jgi:sphinganine-1-phosphate aldolase